MALDHTALLQRAQRADELERAGKLGERERRTIEQRARRVAKRQGLELTRSRRRDPLAYDFGGYMIVDPSTNAAVAGTASGRGYGMSLGEAVAWLLEP